MNTHPFSLEVIEVASPCHASWDDMTGDDRSRFCSQCAKQVYNLSGLSREEAERLVQESEGPMCVRFYRRADGTILTEDCPVGLWDVRTRFARLWAGALAMIGFLTFGAMSWGSRSSHAEEPAEGSDAQSGPVAALRESLEKPQMSMGFFCVPSSRSGSDAIPMVEEPPLSEDEP